MQTISLSQLRTQTKRLQALLAAKQTVTLLKGSQVVGHIVPDTKDNTPLFLKGYNLGKSKYDFVKRKDFYE